MDSMKYNASSPDELALVYAARYFGATFVDRTEDNIVILNWFGKKKQYQLLNIFEFNSDRKRMSVVFKDNEGKLFIITKGADTVIKKRLKDYNVDSNEDNYKIEEHLEFFGGQGLRTLLFAQREITEKEYANFKDQLNVCLIFNIIIKYLFKI